MRAIGSLLWCHRSAEPHVNEIENPPMTLSGVRNSWLTLPRNADFARFATSAAARRASVSPKSRALPSAIAHRSAMFDPIAISSVEIVDRPRRSRR